MADIGFIIGMTLYLVGFAFFAYSCILADPSTSASARFCTQTLPNHVGDKVANMLGPRVLSALRTVGDYALVVVYLVVVLGCWSIVLTHGYELVGNSQYVSNYHMYVGYVVFAACMASWRKACTARPGWITARTMPKYDNWEYDNLLYTNRICPTVGIRKLPRSKYDRATQRHVPRFDHFCGWVSNAIGEENYRYFLLFLAVHVGMCAYGTIIIAKCFYGEIMDQDLLNATFYLASTGESVTASKMVVLQYLMARHFALAGVLLMMSVMGFVLAIFLGFHLYITAFGMTTNEWYKWRQVRKWHASAKRKYDRAVKEGRAVDTNESKIMVVDQGDGDVGCTGPTGPTDTSVSSEPQHADANGSCSTSITDDNAEQEDQGENKELDDSISNPGPYPTNIYNQGILENFREVVYPRCLRDDAIEQWTKAYYEAEAEKQSQSKAPIQEGIQSDKQKVQ